MEIFGRGRGNNVAYNSFINSTLKTFLVCNTKSIFIRLHVLYFDALE